MASSDVLDRHLSTVGIEDVFLEPPDHPFLSTYLDPSKCDGSSFLSWEIVGAIKTDPEDFVVREIAPKGWKIPGVSEEDMNRLRMASLEENDERIEQNLDMSDRKRATEAKDAPTETNQERKENEFLEENPVKVISKYLAYVKDSGADILEEIEAMNKRAQTRTKALSEGLPEASDRSTDDAIMVPQFIPKDEEEPSIDVGSIRGAFHRAVKAQFPLLQTESVKIESEETKLTENCIKISIDKGMDEIVPFLSDAEVDLEGLYRFQKRGCGHLLGAGGKRAWRGGKGVDERALKFSKAESNDHQAILRLKPTVDKEGRRVVHHAITQKCRQFETSTIVPETKTDSNDSDAKNGAYAVVVKWSRQSLFKGSRKRKSASRNQVGQSSSDDPFPHLLCVLRKRQREHLTVIHDLTMAMKCRQADIGLAGIKDMQAITYQFCTFRDMNWRRIQSANSRLESKGVELGRALQTNQLINKGDLHGNHFEITVRDLRRILVSSGPLSAVEENQVPCERSHIMAMADRIRTKGFINFFGEQRVGAAGKPELVGTRSFDIGRAMLKQDYSKAIDLLMSGRSSDHDLRNETDYAQKVRQVWKDTGGDPEATLKAIPGGNAMPRERAVLRGLKRYGKDNPLEALKCLQYNMRTFWINAYQSYCWNVAASQRIRRYGVQVVPGDLYTEPDEGEIRIVGTNASEVPLDQVVLPLPGHNVRYPGNEIAGVYKRILEKDGIKMTSDAPAESTVKGSYRRLIAQVDDLKVDFDTDLHNVLTNGTAEIVKLSFSLQKGSYATMMLRELMLATASRWRSSGVSLRCRR